MRSSKTAAQMCFCLWHITKFWKHFHGKIFSTNIWLSFRACIRNRLQWLLLYVKPLCFIINVFFDVCAPFSLEITMKTSQALDHCFLIVFASAASLMQKCKNYSTFSKFCRSCAIVFESSNFIIVQVLMMCMTSLNL